MVQHQHERLSTSTYPSTFDALIGKSPVMQQVFTTIRQVAKTDVDILIHGETGTGKELVARSIHGHSRRRDAPFVPVDCGAMPEHLVESEFFGHERGAFTGAYEQSVGLLEVAHGGTLFLDEIGGTPLSLQAKLLRVLQERTLRRVGGRKEIDLNLRVIAASSRDLVTELRARRFREDLYYRLNVVQIVLPPLRKRQDDIPLLIADFVDRYLQEMGRPTVELKPEVIEVLTAYSWPGNVRELQNVLKRALAMSHGSTLSLHDLPDEIVVHASDQSLPDTGFFHLRQQRVTAFEREYLTNLLRCHRGDVSQASWEAQVPRGTLYRLLKKHGLTAEEFRLDG